MSLCKSVHGLESQESPTVHGSQSRVSSALHCSIYNLSLVSKLDGSEFWEWGVFWSIWAFIFDILCVRVTAEGEVDYGLVTEGITDG